MAVKFGILAQWMSDQLVLLGTMAFVKFSMPVGVKLFSHCSFAVHAFHYRFSFISAENWKKCVF